MSTNQDASSSSSSSARQYFYEHDENFALMADCSPSEMRGDDHRQVAELDIKSQPWPEVRILAMGSESDHPVFKNLKQRRLVRNLLDFGMRGTANFVIYLWIIKDMSWTQSWYQTSLVFAVMSVFAQALVLLRSACDWDLIEFWHILAETLWLFANFWAMTGEEYDETFQTEALGDPRDVESGMLMVALLCWLGVYHLFLNPLGMITRDSNTYLHDLYDVAGLKSRFSCFKNWRDYEYMHIVCWIGKDCSWMLGYPWLWIFWTIPTLLLAIDFVYVTRKTKIMVIDHAHYVAQLLWVIGNIIWAYGDLFIGLGMDPAPMLEWNPKSPRWWASWTIASAFLPIIWLYFYVIPLNYFSKKNHVIPQEEQSSFSKNNYDYAEDFSNGKAKDINEAKI